MNDVEQASGRKGDPMPYHLEKGGMIIRTAAHGARKADMERELQYLFKLYEVLQQRVKSAAAGTMVFQEADLPVRVVRDVFSKEFERAVIDDLKADCAAAGLRDDLDLELYALRGQSAETLVAAARKAEMLVIGVRGAGGFSGLRFGSTATQVVRHSAVPVLVVPALGGLVVDLAIELHDDPRVLAAESAI